MSKTSILLVEDNEDDVLLTLTALKRLGWSKDVAVCRDGVEALEFILCEGAHRERDSSIQPRLILMDIKLPKMDGIEVVRRIKSDPNAKAIPVVMLTSSSRQADVTAAHNAGAEHYLTKSVEFGRFSEEIGRLTRQLLGSREPG